MNNLKKAFKKYGVTSANIADKMGITPASMSNIVNGNPSLDTLQRVASVIGISVSELLADDEQPSRPSAPVCPHCGKPINITLT